MIERRRSHAALTWFVVCCLSSPAFAADETPGPTLPDAVYADYKPTFDRALPQKLRGFSIQPTFYNRAHVRRDKRVDALIQEGIRREEADEYPEAIKHYQTIIEKYPDVVIQVSEYGVFISAPLYVQHRILRFPKKHLAYYRLLYDAAARDVYERALARYSVAGLREVADFHLATSYGAKALLQIGSRGLDLGHVEEAARVFERIKRWFPTTDTDAYEVNFRLAYAYRLLGRSKRFREVASELKRTGLGAKARTELDPEILSRVKPLRPKPDAFTPQKRHPRHVSFSDYDLLPSLATPLSSGTHQWRVQLPMAPGTTSDDQASRGEALPFHLPWVVANGLYYKHYNRVYCRSIVTGKLRWVYDLGPLERMVRRYRVLNYGRPYATTWYADQDILVDGDLVFANVQVYGRRESLVAIDRITGELRWAVGPVRPMDEDDLMTRYDASPALGRQAIYAPWSRDRGDGGDLLYTAVGLTAFDKETGRVIWKKEICQLSPTVTTQRKFGVRVCSTTPLVREGIVYHVTNAGVVTAVDATSGMVRWITRYPHLWRKANDIDAHDEVPFGSAGSSSFAQQAGPRYQNQTPLLSGDLLYVTPFDSDHFLALDKTSGRILWNMVAQGPLEGIAATGELVFAGRNIAFYGPKMRFDFYDPLSRRLNWSFYPTYRSTWGTYRHARGQYLKMSIISHPTMTEDGRMYFSTLATPYTSSSTIQAHRQHPVYGEWCLSVTDRKLIDYRIYYAPKYRDQVEGTLKGKIKDQKDFQAHLPDVPPMDVNAPVPYDAVRRLPFRHHGVTFELVTTGDTLRARYDAAALTRAVAGGASPAQLFAHAEILLGRGREVAAIDAFEKCRARLKPEETTFIREINRELFRLYRRRAWKARLADDTERFHKRALQMAETAITVREDIQSLLTLAESFERQSNVDRAAKCLQSIVRHYTRAIYAMPSLALADTGAHEKSLVDAVASLGVRKPKDRETELLVIEKIAKTALPAHFSTVAPIAPDAHLEAENVAREKLTRLLAKHPGYRTRFEELAETALARGDLRSREAEMRAFPGTRASQKVLDELLAEAGKREPHTRQARLWKLHDTATTLGLTLPAAVADASRLKPVETKVVPFRERLATRTHVWRDAGETLRLPLARREDAPVRSNLLFIGGRSRKRLGNKFSIACWNTDTWKTTWQVTNLRLKGAGDEPGFEEVFVLGNLVVTHGRHDVLAFGLANGDLRWRFEVPFDFDLRAVNHVGELLVLSGATHTLGVQAATGTVVWNEKDIGELYHPPFVREGVLVGVRREPYGVTFRRTGSGRLVRHLKLPDLNLLTKHPVLAEDISRGAIKAGVSSEALPVACKGDLLMLTDGVSYIAVDVRKMTRRWTRVIDNNDVGDPPMRFFIEEPYLLVLKRDFNVPALYLIDTRTGEVKWQKKARDVVHSIVFDPDKSGTVFHGLATPRTETRNFTLRSFDTETGREIMSWTGETFTGVPDVAITGTFANGRIALRAIHRQDFELIVFDTRAKRVVDRLSMKGVGTYGVHGGKSALVQEDTTVLMSPEGLSAAVPKQGGPGR